MNVKSFISTSAHAAIALAGFREGLAGDIRGGGEIDFNLRLLGDLNIDVNRGGDVAGDVGEVERVVFLLDNQMPFIGPAAGDYTGT